MIPAGTSHSLGSLAFQSHKTSLWLVLQYKISWCALSPLCCHDSGDHRLLFKAKPIGELLVEKKTEKERPSMLHSMCTTSPVGAALFSSWRCAPSAEMPGFHGSGDKMHFFSVLELSLRLVQKAWLYMWLGVSPFPAKPMGWTVVPLVSIITTAHKVNWHSHVCVLRRIEL